MPKQKAQFIKFEFHINALIQADKKELLRILKIEKEGGLQVFLRLLDWFAKVGKCFAKIHQTRNVVAMISQLPPSVCQSLRTGDKNVP